MKIAKLLSLMVLLAGGPSIASDVVFTLPNGATYRVPYNDQANITVSPNGDIGLRSLSQQGSPGDGWCPGTGGPLPPVFNSPLNANPSSLLNGGSTTLTWSTSNTTSCTGAATLNGTATSISGWTGTRTTSSSGLILSLSTGTYSFSLTCSGPGGSVQSLSQPVIVSPVISGCTGVVPIFGLTRQTAMRNSSALQGNTEWPSGTTINVQGFSPLFGARWPARLGNGTLTVNQNKFVAMEFNTGNLDAATYGPGVYRFGTFEWSPPSYNGGQPLIVISKCAGDFVNPASPRCVSSGSGASLWPWVVGAPDQGACSLLPNTTYFLNVAFVNPSTGADTCTIREGNTGSNPGSCHWFMQPR